MRSSATGLDKDDTADRPRRLERGTPVPDISDPRRRLVISADMANYSRRNNMLQYHAQRDFRQIMDAAAAELAVDRPSWRQQQGGDGELAILPPDASERTLVAKLTPVLDTLLRQYNVGRTAESRIRLRVAVHQGLVHLDGANGFPGEAVNTVSRLVDAPVLKDALRRRFPRANVGLIVSDQLYSDVVCHYHDLRPDLFQKVVAELPDKDFCQPAWLYVPHENAALDDDHKDTPASAAASHRGPPAATGPAQEWHDNTVHAPAIFGNNGTQNFGRDPQR
jgi:class 3 adenylate cyclase